MYKWYSWDLPITIITWSGLQVNNILSFLLFVQNLKLVIPYFHDKVFSPIWWFLDDVFVIFGATSPSHCLAASSLLTIFCITNFLIASIRPRQVPPLSSRSILLKNSIMLLVMCSHLILGSMVYRAQRSCSIWLRNLHVARFRASISNIASMKDNSLAFLEVIKNHACNLWSRNHTLNFAYICLVQNLYEPINVTKILITNYDTILSSKILIIICQFTVIGHCETNNCWQ